MKLDRFDYYLDRIPKPAGTSTDFFDPVPNGNLPPMPYTDMPEPLPLGKVLGPSVILAGIGVGSGEYIIWPFMASTVGLGFLWAGCAQCDGAVLHQHGDRALYACDG